MGGELAHWQPKPVNVFQSPNSAAFRTIRVRRCAGIRIGCGHQARLEECVYLPSFTTGTSIRVTARAVVQIGRFHGNASGRPDCLA